MIFQGSFLTDRSTTLSHIFIVVLSIFLSINSRYTSRIQVAASTLSILGYYKNHVMNPPQKDVKFVGAFELPPIDTVPPTSQGYIVILAQ